jgi:hypothetical protein
VKALLVSLVAIGLGSVVATVWIGASVREDTVVAQPYEEGLRYDETRRARAAAAGLGDTAGLPARSAHGRGKPVASPASGAVPAAAPADGPARGAASSAAEAAEPGDALTLAISPDPPPAMSELTFTVRVSRDGAPVEAADVELRLEMPGMYMGENRVPLVPLGGGVYRGTGAVVRCASGKRGWEATVVARPAGGGAPIERRFGFEVVDR